MQRAHDTAEFMRLTHNPNAWKRHYHPTREAQGVYIGSWTSRPAKMGNFQ
jgi:hypothetical protein